MKRKIAFITMLAALLVSVSSSQESGADTTARKTTPTSGTTAVVDQQYKIGPEDVLTVSVWREPDLSGPAPVRPDGKITMALVGDIPASGMTAVELGSSIEEKLRKYLTDPRVTVVVSEVRSKRIYVIGEVARQGPMSLTPGMRVSQAISSAGGFSQFANTKKIFVLRNVSGTQNKFKFNYKDFIEGRNTEQDIQLTAGDTVVVP